LDTYIIQYEIDSLCGFIKLSRRYFEATNDSSIMNDECVCLDSQVQALIVTNIVVGFTAIDQVLTVIEEQSQASFDEDFNFISYYNWTGEPGSLSPGVPNGGNGEPKGYTGLVGTHHRPSDDLSVFAFLTPANAMLSVELSSLANVLDAAGLGANVSIAARNYSQVISDAIWNTTVRSVLFIPTLLTRLSP
jgi:uncharacterized protein